MANLARPVNMLKPVEERIIEFKGLNKRTVVEEGEMSDMKNLTADAYPVLKPRKPRGKMTMPEGILRPIRLVRRFDKIGIIAIDENDPDDPDPQTVVSFYYDGVKVDEIDDLTTESRAVAINNRMCFFPQKTCIDITKDGVQAGTYRSLESSYTAPLAGTAVTVTATEVYLDVTKGLFNYDDAITISGTLGYTPSGGSPTSMPIEVSCIIEAIEKGGEDDTTDRIWLPANTFIEVVGASDITLVQETTIKRECPDLDMTVEWNNRLWGVNNAGNIIYACKLGDPFNWQYYQGTSLDSYYAEQGTDESFTGIAEYSGHLIFFKPNSMTRVYGTSPSNFQITNTKAYGVESGSSGSVLTINDTVFYKSSIGFMAYQGGVPFCISDKLNYKMRNAVAGTEGRRYMASCVVKEGGLSSDRIFVFDIGTGLWHMQDDMRFTNALKVEDKIYVASAGARLTCDIDVLVQDEDGPDRINCGSDYVTGDVLIVNPDTIIETHAEAEVADPDDPPENYEDMEWMAVFGPFDEWLEEHKIYSKLAMRLVAKGNASAKVYISINEGPWEQIEHYERVSTKGDFIPIIPRRCDRYSVKIEGKGNFEVKSLTRRVRKGSFGRL